MLASERRLRAYDRQVQGAHDWRWNEVRGFGASPASRSASSASAESARPSADGRGASASPCSPRTRAWTPPKCAATARSRGARRAPRALGHRHAALQPRGRQPQPARPQGFREDEAKPLLINVARGALVVEADLAEALDRGLLRGAALDVLAEDSPDLGHHALVGRDNVLLTPHVAFYSETALEDLRRISAANITAFLEGRPDAVFRLVPAPAGTP